MVRGIKKSRGCCVDKQLERASLEEGDPVRKMCLEFPAWNFSCSHLNPVVGWALVTPYHRIWKRFKNGEL